MSKKYMYGKELAVKVADDIKRRIKELNYSPKLAIIQVGHNDASDIYIKYKLQFCKNVGIDVDICKFDMNISKEKIINKIKTINKDKNINSILIQLPLPKSLENNKQEIIDYIEPNKDVDGLTSINQGRLISNIKGIIPATPKAILKILNYYNVELPTKNAVIVGRSNLVGKPLSYLLLNENCTVTICHSKTKKIEEFTSKADILVVAVGKREIINKNMVKDGAIVIDVGINREKEKIIGDVSQDVHDKVSKITPVPGGVGPVTVACLAENVLDCCEIQHYSNSIIDAKE